MKFSQTVGISRVENYSATENNEFIYIKLVYRISGFLKTDVISGVTSKSTRGHIAKIRS